MGEMILPGTYVTVRAEGLISAGRIATGIVGVIGTAEKGPVNTAKTLSSYAEARDIFGLDDEINNPIDGSNPLTLTRSLEQTYANGASSIIAVRVAGSAQSMATYAVRDSSDNHIATLTAKTPGTWAHELKITTDAAEAHCEIEKETHTTGFASLNYTHVVPTIRNRVQIYRGTTKQFETLTIVYKQVFRNEELVANAEGRYFVAHTPVENVADINVVDVLNSDGEPKSPPQHYGDGAILYGPGNTPDSGEVRITGEGEVVFAADQLPEAGDQVIVTYAVGHDAPEPGEILITIWDGSIEFASATAPVQANGDQLIASYLVDKSACIMCNLSHDAITESYVVPDGRELVRRVNTRSDLVSGETNAAHEDKLPSKGIAEYFGVGSNTPGNNGADASGDDYGVGLEALANMLVNIVVLAGQNADDMGSVLLGHLNTTEQDAFERIGVIGAKGNTVNDFLGHNMADDRIVLVAPGIQFPDGTQLPSAYTAAAVAGVLSSLQVQTSLTNRPVNVPGVNLDINKGQQAQLIKRNVLTVARKNGFRVIKGVTTAGEGTPFSAIPTRRIVDYAKYGVRSAADPYLGRLNNDRVRTAMKATIDAFLTRMVDSEALTGYELDVSATRAQEIAGEVSVTMTLQPTFSIEYIRVTMVLK